MDMMAQMMGAQFAMYGGLAMLAWPFVLYVLARWRAHREQGVDPQLGIKVALGYFAFIGLQLLLVGLTLFFYALLSTGASDDKGTMYRAAAGFILPGAIVLATHVVLLRRTNQDQYPAVRRLLLGYNLIATGTVGLVALVIAFQALFGKGSSGEVGRVAGAMLLVYGSAWVGAGVAFGRDVLGNYPPPGGSAAIDMAVTPGAPPTQPGLPPLRDGAFPPLDQR